MAQVALSFPFFSKYTANLCTVLKGVVVDKVSTTGT